MEGWYLSISQILQFLENSSQSDIYCIDLRQWSTHQCNQSNIHLKSQGRRELDKPSPLDKIPGQYFSKPWTAPFSWRLTSLTQCLFWVAKSRAFLALIWNLKVNCLSCARLSQHLHTGTFAFLSEASFKLVLNFNPRNVKFGLNL